jgi:hypothetical protein
MQARSFSAANDLPFIGLASAGLNLRLFGKLRHDPVNFLPPKCQPRGLLYELSRPPIIFGGWNVWRLASICNKYNKMNSL